MNRREQKNASDLSGTVAALTSEIRVLRDAIDELREEIRWMNDNVPHAKVSRDRRIWSMSLDPTDKEFTVNSVEPETVERFRREASESNSETVPQGKLFS